MHARATTRGRAARTRGEGPLREHRKGSGLVEVLVVILVVGVLALLLMLGLTRSREVARSATCSRNLQQIGQALSLYDQATLRVPYVAPLDGPAGPLPGPLALMLEQLGLDEVTGLDLARVPGTLPTTTEPVGERYLPGFVCPSDPIATSRVFPAPTNYRANTGDRVEGRRGPFAPDSSVGLAEVEAADGASYTAAFAERLVGTAGTSREAIRDYRLEPGPVPQDGCPDRPAAPLQTDAGRSWLESGWRSTLYSHASAPQAPRSCIAEDGRTALMGASSGHVEGVRVLLMDGSVRVYSTSVNPAVWAALGTTGIEETPPAPTPVAPSDAPTPDAPEDDATEP